MSKKICCIARFRAKEGKEAELFEVLNALEPDTLQEEDGIRSIVTPRIDNPCAGGSANYLVWLQKSVM